MDYRAISAEGLFQACVKTGDAVAWAEFVRRFQPLIASVVLRVSRSWTDATPELVDDLIQETYLKLCDDRLQVLKNFKPAHEDAVYGFIKVFTANLVHDHFKALRAEKRGGSATTSSIDTSGSGEIVPSSGAPVTMERQMLIQEVASCLARTTSGSHAERDRRIFWLYYRAGLSASGIAALPTIGLSTKGVESTILRLTRVVRRELTSQRHGQASSSGSVEGIRPTESL